MRAGRTMRWPSGTRPASRATRRGSVPSARPRAISAPFKVRSQRGMRVRRCSAPVASSSARSNAVSTIASCQPIRTGTTGRIQRPVPASRTWVSRLSIRADRFEHEAVTPGQTAAWGELEEDPPARLVLDHRVADGPVTAVGADTERAVEDHRFGNPDVRRPQPILGGANRGSRRLAQAAPPWRNTRSRQASSLELRAERRRSELARRVSNDHPTKSPRAAVTSGSSAGAPASTSLRYSAPHARPATPVTSSPRRGTGDEPAIGTIVSRRDTCITVQRWRPHPGAPGSAPPYRSSRRLARGARG
jgi:hypothetical protein